VRKTIVRLCAVVGLAASSLFVAQALAASVLPTTTAGAQAITNKGFSCTLTPNPGKAAGYSNSCMPGTWWGPGNVFTGGGCTYKNGNVFYQHGGNCNYGCPPGWMLYITIWTMRTPVTMTVVCSSPGTGPPAGWPASGWGVSYPSTTPTLG
jgi:hypothetical protein